MDDINRELDRLRPGHPRVGLEEALLRYDQLDGWRRRRTTLRDRAEAIAQTILGGRPVRLPGGAPGLVADVDMDDAQSPRPPANSSPVRNFSRSCCGSGRRSSTRRAAASRSARPTRSPRPPARRATRAILDSARNPRSGRRWPLNNCGWGRTRPPPRSLAWATATSTRRWRSSSSTGESCLRAC
ncbi:hypothetical protein NKH18_50470 [Streptomyces sp. M10(2022)]